MRRRPVTTAMTDARDGPDERELVARLRRGQREAQGEAYLRYRDRVFSVVYRIVGRRAVAAELTHDAFLRAFERAAEFRGDCAFGTWVTRIATNLALGHLRRERWLRFALPEDVPEPVRPVSSAALDLDRAILALPDALRTVFVLHAVEGHSYAEVAVLLDISEAACRQRLHRARARLAAALTEHRRGGTR